MPIHFYCVYCDKQLGIATRKAGHIVTCPNCAKQIRVPLPEEGTEDAKVADGASDIPAPIETKVKAAAPAPAANARPTPANLFENSNFADILHAAPAVVPAAVPMNAAPVPAVAIDLPKPEPAAPLPAVRLQPQPPVATAAPLPARSGLYLSPTRATAILVLFVFLIAGSFICGMIVGRILAGE